MRRRLSLVVAPLLLATVACPGLGIRIQRRDGGAGGGGGSPPPAGGGSGGGETGGGSQPAPSPAPQAGAHLLEARWRPLERIEERPPLPGLGGSTATTISPVLYVDDLDGWLKKHPPGSNHYEALLAHEQVHARRQEAAGVDPWIQRYLRDREFMWAEEQRGWYAQIRRLQQANYMIDAAAVARQLTQYRNLSGSMVGQEEALRWAQDAIGGRWYPKD